MAPVMLATAPLGTMTRSLRDVGLVARYWRVEGRTKMAIVGWGRRDGLTRRRDELTQRVADLIQESDGARGNVRIGYTTRRALSVWLTQTYHQGVPVVEPASAGGVDGPSRNLSLLKLANAEPGV